MRSELNTICPKKGWRGLKKVEFLKGNVAVSGKIRYLLYMLLGINLDYKVRNHSEKHWITEVIILL